MICVTTSDVSTTHACVEFLIISSDSGEFAPLSCALNCSPAEVGESDAPEAATPKFVVCTTAPEEFAPAAA